MQATNALGRTADNRSMPNITVIPVLHYPDVAEAVPWLCRAFGFTERLRIGNHRTQLSIGEGAVVVAQCAKPESPIKSSNHSVMVRVSNLDRHYEKAKAAGGRIIGAPAIYPYGERQYAVADIGGHVW